MGSLLATTKAGNNSACPVSGGEGICAEVLVRPMSDFRPISALAFDLFGKKR